MKRSTLSWSEPSTFFFIVTLILSLHYGVALAGAKIDLTNYFLISTSEEESLLDRQTMTVTSTSKVTLKNRSAALLSLPVDVVIELTDCAAGSVQMPHADGGPGTQPYGTFYIQTGNMAIDALAALYGNNDMSQTCSLDADGDGDIDGLDITAALSGKGLKPGEELSINLTFVRGAETTFRYNIKVFGEEQLVSTHPPKLSLQQEFTVDEGAVLTFEVSAHDEDNETVVISAAPMIRNAEFTSLPSTAPTGTFTFRPGYDQQGIYLVAFRARDRYGFTDEKTVRITVNNINRGPEIAVPATVEVDEGSIITIPVTASDPDGDRLLLSSAPLPENAIFVPASGSITFAPDFDQAGSYSVTCRASDGNLEASASVQINVNDVSQGSGGGHELVLNVHEPESPTLLSTARITGSVNSAAAPSAKRITSALITAVTPSAVRQGERAIVTLSGETSGDFATHFAQNLSHVTFGQGIMVNSITVNSSWELVADITVDPEAATGIRPIEVISGDERAVCLIAFNVEAGISAITGKVTDVDSGQPLSGAVVSIQGTPFSTTTGGQGEFSFHDISAGQHLLVVNAPDHELLTIKFDVSPGSQADVGTLGLTALVYDPSSGPAVSLPSILGRGASSLFCRHDREKIRQMIVDTMLLLGGDGEVGVLDAYGNQLHPEVEGEGVFSLKDSGVDFIATKLMRNELYTLADLLAGVSLGFEWGGEGTPLTLPQWLEGLQAIVNRAWADPTNPENLPVLIIFNQGNSLTLAPPELKPFTKLNALQAFLFTTGLYCAMEQVSPHEAGLLEKIFNTASEFLVSTAFAGPDTSALSRAAYNRYWRGFFEAKSSWPLTRIKISQSEFTFATGFISAISISAPSVLAPMTASSMFISGNMIPDMAQVFCTAWTMAHLPDPPEITEIMFDPATQRVEVHFRPSPSEDPGYDWLYTLCYFSSPDARPEFKASYMCSGWALEELDSNERVMFDESPPEKGTGFYAMTVTRRYHSYNRQEIHDSLMPFWGLINSHVTTDEYIWYLKGKTGITSDWSDPWLYAPGDQQIERKDLEALHVYTSGYSRFAFASDTRNGVIWAHRLDSPSGEDESHAEFSSWAGISEKGASSVWHIDVGFKEPGQKGLAMDENQNLYTDNAASDMIFGGRIFKFPLTGGKIFTGSINYFSRMLGYARPAAAGPMAFGPEPDRLDPSLPGQLYVWDRLEGSIKAVPVLEENDPYHRVGHLFTDALKDHGGAIDMEWQDNRLFVLQPDRIAEIIRHENPATGEWETVIESHELFQSQADAFIPGGLAVCPCIEGIPGACNDEERRFMVTDNTNGRVLQIKTSSNGDLISARQIVGGLDHPGDIDLGDEGKVFALINGNAVRHYYTGLTAQVVDADGNPLPGATVTVFGDIMGEKVTMTDGDGTFSVMDITMPPGADDTVVVTVTYDNRSIEVGVFLDENCQTFRTIVFNPDSAKGIIAVDIEPDELAEQVKWKLGSGEGSGLATDVSVSVLPGRYHVTFSPVPGWITPDDAWVIVEENLRVVVQGIYTREN